MRLFFLLPGYSNVTTGISEHANRHRGERLLCSGLQAKFETKSTAPPLGYQTVAKACIHLWKTWRPFSHTALLSLYLQMVLLSRNVTFDLLPHMERPYQ